MQCWLSEHSVRLSIGKPRCFALFEQTKSLTRVTMKQGSMFAALLLAAFAPLARGDVINVSTGLNASNQIITTGAVNDAHWTVTVDPTFSPTGIPQTVFPNNEPENFLTFLRVFRLCAESFLQGVDGVRSDGGVSSLLSGLGARIGSRCTAPQPGRIVVAQPVHRAPIRSARSDRSGPRCTPTPTTSPRTAPSSNHAPAADPTRARSSIPR